MTTVEAVATGVTDALKAQPILLVIVVLNVIMVAGAAYFMSTVAAHVHEERTMLIERCLNPTTRSPP